MDNTGHGTVRTRIAPSPTGAPHIGTAYIALFNYAFAKSQGGAFLLRIEDTDQARSTRESEQAIFEALRWMGIPWDEGPDVGGPCGPYRQSERLALYREECARLVAAGQAYPCFCTAERLAALRAKQTADKAANVGYDGLCAAIAPAEAQRRIAAGEPCVVRLAVPAEGECVFQDRIRGEIRVPWAKVDAQVLLKTDGFPTYHLANVVDDHHMGITHVIRGEEWISSTPKHLLLYRGFGWTPPEFAHLPLLRNPDKSKLSKRKNPTSILYYRAAGYLPEALLNYLGLMAYSRPDGGEIFTRDQMVGDFRLDRVSLGGPIFDLQKLTNFNAQYIRALAPADLVARLRQWRLNETTWEQIAPLAQPRLNRLSDLVPMASFLFADRLEYAASALVMPDLDGPKVARLLRTVQWEMERRRTWDRETIKELFATVGEKEGLRLKKLLMPFFVVFSGTSVSLPLFESLEILGRDLSLRRLAYALEILAAQGVELKGQALRDFEEEYESRYGAKD